MVNVPCNGCTACCLGMDAAVLSPSDDDRLWNLYPSGRIERTERCPLLGEDGCTVQDYKPLACRAFDCRVMFRTFMEKSKYQQTNILRRVPHAEAVLQAGKERQ